VKHIRSGFIEEVDVSEALDDLNGIPESPDA